MINGINTQNYAYVKNKDSNFLSDLEKTSNLNDKCVINIKPNNMTTTLNNIKYEKMERGINKVLKTISDFNENENKINGHFLKVVDGKVCTRDNKPYSGVSKTLIRPGITIYGSFEDGKIKTQGIVAGKTYAVFNRENNSCTVYTQDSKNNKYLTKITDLMDNFKTPDRNINAKIYTIYGNKQNMKSCYSETGNISKIAKNGPLGQIKVFSILKKHLGEDAMCDIAGRTLLQVYVFNNQKALEIYA